MLYLDLLASRFIDMSIAGETTKMAAGKAEATRARIPASESLPTRSIYSPKRAEFEDEQKGNFLTWAELGSEGELRFEPAMS